MKIMNGILLYMAAFILNWIFLIMEAYLKAIIE